MDYIFHITEAKGFSSLYIMESEGKAMIRVYQYYDEPDVSYIDTLHVHKDYRREGIGGKMLSMAELTEFNEGRKTLFLWTYKDSWQQKWYERKEYVYHSIYDVEDNAIWMKKILR